MVDTFLESNYDSLNKIAQSYCIGTQMPPKDLVGDLILYLYDNEEKVKTFLSCDSSLIRFSKKYMWNQTHLYTKNKGVSNFKSKFQIYDNPDPQHIEIGIEINETLIGEYERDLSGTYTEEQIKKIVFTNNFIPKLNEIEKRLFQLHFEERMSHTKIALYLQEKYNQKVSPSSVYNMLVHLRQKIKNEYETKV